MRGGFAADGGQPADLAIFQNGRWIRIPLPYAYPYGTYSRMEYANGKLMVCVTSPARTNPPAWDYSYVTAWNGAAWTPPPAAAARRWSRTAGCTP